MDDERLNERNEKYARKRLLAARLMVTGTMCLSLFGYAMGLLGNNLDADETPFVVSGVLSVAVLLALSAAVPLIPISILPTCAPAPQERHESKSETEDLATSATQAAPAASEQTPPSAKTAVSTEAGEKADDNAKAKPPATAHKAVDAIRLLYALQDDELTKLHLTKQEHAVARLILEGIPYHDVAKKAFIAESTVKFHARNIYRKAQVGSRNDFAKRIRTSVNKRIVLGQDPPRRPHR